ncbi:MAG: DnaJ domain-containing protein [Clostridia bacterium]|nr:DnaJ domain-containing protein [Clostridia bacterium]
MIFKDYYKILGLETSKVTIDQIKNSYRDLAKKYHPDVNSNDKMAEERFKDLTEAYRILSDSTSKRKYDRIWNYNVGRKKKSNQKDRDAKFTDFFNMFFGTEQETIKKTPKKKVDNTPIKGSNIETEITATVLETFYGREKTIVMKNLEGNEKKFKIKIPSGIRNGEKIRVIGQGKEGQNGGRNGDLYLSIKIVDTEEFKLKGIDIETYLNISPWEATLNKKVNVHGIDEEITIKLPEGVQNGEKIVIKGKGYIDGKGGRGDLIAETKIVVPQTITKEEEKLYKKLEEISKFNPRQK